MANTTLPFRLTEGTGAIWQGDNPSTGNNNGSGGSVSSIRFSETYKRVKLPKGNGIVFVVAKGNNVYDMSQLVESITWSGAKSSMPRTLEVTMLDSDRKGHARPDINIEAGQQCLFLYNGKELFRGILFGSSQSVSRSADRKSVV